MLLMLAQTTQPYIVRDIPPGWVAVISSMGVILTAIGVIIGYIIKRQGATTQNVQALGAATLANSKAINQSPGPSVSHEVEQAAREIRNDPSKPAAIPVNTDPIPPTLQQRMDFKQAVEESRNPIQ
jgi:type II secretory pathway pseudopilin PulG